MSGRLGTCPVLETLGSSQHSSGLVDDTREPDTMERVRQRCGSQNKTERVAQRLPWIEYRLLCLRPCTFAAQTRRPRIFHPIRILNHFVCMPVVFEVTTGCM